MKLDYKLLFLFLCSLCILSYSFFRVGAGAPAQGSLQRETEALIATFSTAIDTLSDYGWDWDFQLLSHIHRYPTSVGFLLSRLWIDY